MSDLSWCRHCGTPGAMSAEHLPAKSVGNDQAINEVAWPGDSVVADALRQWPDGFALPTLCPRCNGNGSRWGYVKEYCAWRAAAVEALERHCQIERRFRPAKFKPGEVIDWRLPYDRMPGRFARYVVGMFLAVQRNQQLLTEHPQLAGAVQETDGKAPPMPCAIAPARLFVAFANRNVVLTCDNVMTASFRPSGSTAAGLLVPPATGPTGFMQLAVYSPFASHSF